MSREASNTVRIVCVATAAATLAACAAKAPPPPPPPPPVAQVIVPIRPLPPSQAPYVMEIPRKDSLGIRQTINTGISSDEKLWYFRSAWNVAALNCLGAEAQTVLDGYSSFIKGNARTLKAANDRIDASYHKGHGGKTHGIRAREAKMTMVYNYFTLPAARLGFCRTAQDISARWLADPKADATAFALTNFPLFERPFEDFFLAYEAYQRDSAAWDAQWGASYGASQPGYVAVQRALAAHRVPTVTSNPAATLPNPATPAGVVVDPTSGAQIPVVPVDASTGAKPVVQPVPTTPTPGN